MRDHGEPAKLSRSLRKRGADTFIHLILERNAFTNCQIAYVFFSSLCIYTSCDELKRVKSTDPKSLE